MRIGITERGDAGINQKWFPQVMNGMVDGAVLITKHITKTFMENVIWCQNESRKLIVHATCTGWGGTIVEPNVPAYKDQLEALKNLIDMGFPVENCVLRIDPVIPSEKGLELVRKVIACAESKGILPGARIRISVFDEYKHVKKRLIDQGFQSFYPGNNFQASEEQFKRTAELLSEYDYVFHACAEPKLMKYGKPGRIRHTGCISNEDLVFMDLDISEDLSVNKQNRSGCLCLSCKTELLAEKHRCPHQCVYCYWQD